MICNKCKNEIPDGSLYCPACGEPLTMPDTSTTNGMPPVILALHNAVSSKLFFVIAIMFTVASGAQFLLGYGVPIFELLTAIAMWIMYSSNLKNNIMGYGTPLKMISGVALANTIVLWVLGGIFALCGIIDFAFGTFAESFMDILTEFGEFTNEEMAILGDSGELLSGIFGVAFIIAAVVVFLINIFLYLKIHKFAKSLSMTFRSGVNQITNLSFTKNAMLVLGILNGIGTVGSIADILALASSGCLAAAYIMLYILLGDLEKEISFRAY